MRGSTRPVNDLDGRNRVIMLNPGNITTEQARTLLDGALTEAFFYADSADALTGYPRFRERELEVLQL
jgi:hypothetical protein